MKLLVLVLTLVAASYAAPQGYTLPTPSGGGFPVGGCQNGEVLNVDGTCAIPQVTRNVFVYTAPVQNFPRPPPASIPPPRQDYNIIFIRTPEQPNGPEPIIVGPPEQNNIVYVLSKRPDGQGQRIIEVPAPPPKSPQVYFVNYGEGENPTLPGGVDLNTALGSAASAGSSVLGGSGGFGGSGGSGFGGSGFGGGVSVGGGGGGFGGGAGGFGGGSGLTLAVGDFDDSGENNIISGGFIGGGSSFGPQLGVGGGGGGQGSPVPQGLYSAP